MAYIADNIVEGPSPWLNEAMGVNGPAPMKQDSPCPCMGPGRKASMNRRYPRTTRTGLNCNCCKSTHLFSEVS
jgi:hypothetical protein